jgi:hypothetical protein
MMITTDFDLVNRIGCEMRGFGRRPVDRRKSGGKSLFATSGGPHRGMADARLKRELQTAKIGPRADVKVEIVPLPSRHIIDRVHEP